MNPLRVAAILPVGPRSAEQVLGAIESIQRQTRQADEIIVVDNGAHLRNLQGVKVVEEHRPGAAFARNTGLGAASTDFCAFLDSDDRWRPHFLERMCAAAERFPLVGTFAGAAIVYRGGVAALVEAPRTGPDPVRALLRYNGISTSAVMVRRDLATEVGGFMEGLATPAGCEDYALWLRLAGEGAIVRVPSALAERFEDANGPRWSAECGYELEMEAAVRYGLRLQPEAPLPRAAVSGLAARACSVLLASGRRRDARTAAVRAVVSDPLSGNAWKWGAIALAPAPAERIVRRVAPRVRAAVRSRAAE